MKYQEWINDDKRNIDISSNLWAAWHAADRAAREDCARICDGIAKQFEVVSWSRDHHETRRVITPAHRCADKIRESIKA